MKARLLVGLLTVALGGLTSCSNILEENGVINNVAESGMGELRINLSTDASVSVVTKAINDADGTYIIKVTNKENQSIIQKVTYEQIQTTPLKLNNGKYIVEAYNKEEESVQDFEWNAPYYKTDGTNEVTISGDSQDKALTCVRANSSLMVDTTSLGDSDASNKILYVKSLIAKNEGKSSLNLIDSKHPLKTDSVCVKAGIPATIELVAVRMDNGKEITVSSPLKKNNESETTADPIDAKTKYNVIYSIYAENGELTLSVKVNDEVTTVPVSVKIDPYK